MGKVKNAFHDEICVNEAKAICQDEGHEMSIVERLRNSYARVICSRCGAAAIRRELEGES